MKIDTRNFFEPSSFEFKRNVGMTATMACSYIWGRCARRPGGSIGLHLCRHLVLVGENDHDAILHASSAQAARDLIAQLCESQSTTHICTFCGTSET